jgi:outer membrane protein assembly factor BamA
LGGLSSVRGASPTSVLRMMLLNAEYRVELVEDALTISGFFDSGVDLDSVSMGTILSSTGLELGVSAAGMFVRLDLAWILGSDWSWTPRFEFGFSRMF